MKSRLLVLAILLASSTIAAQQPPPIPSLSPFNNGKDWFLDRPFAYQIGNTKLIVRVPRGFVTDLTSVPVWGRVFLAPTDQPGRAAIVHDYLYWTQSCTREQADRILMLAMKESQVDFWWRNFIYGAVRMCGDASCGGRPWSSNAAERSKGLPRIIPEAEIGNVGSLTVWPEYRSMLFQRNVRPEPVPTSAPDYCAGAMAISVDDL